MRRLTFVFVLMAAMVFGPRPGAAHPHAWIDLKSTVVFDQDGRIVALDLYWLFDAFYTVFVLEDIARNGDDPQEAITELARANLRNLEPVDYFTEIRSHGLPQALGSVETFETGIEDDRLWLSFRVPLVDPMTPQTDDVSYAMFDPTYYVEMLHTKDDPIALDGAPLGACSARLEEPNPDAEAVTLAAMLAQDEIAPDGLGRMFAQTVHVACE